MSPRTFNITASTLKKTLAGSLCLVIFLTNCALANTSESLFYSRRKNLLAKLPSPSNHLLFQQLPQPTTPNISPWKKYQEKTVPKNNLSSYLESIPLQVGTVRIIENAAPSKAKNQKIVIHIQDVHQNLEAQKNIASAITALTKNSGVPLVALEGSSTDIDLSAFHEFPRHDIVANTAALLLSQNKISGPVYAGFLNPSTKTILTGVENQNLYDSNVDAFKKSFSNVASVKKDLLQLTRKLDAEKKKTWPQALREFDFQVELYRKHEMPLGAFVQLLNTHVPTTTNNTELFLQASLLESRLEFSTANAERALVLEQLISKLSSPDITHLTERSIAYRLGQISHAQFYTHLKNLCRAHGIDLNRTPAFHDYVQYVLLADAVNADVLFQDLQTMEEAAYAHFFTSEADKNLYQKTKALHLTDKLVDFSLTPTEWDAYKNGLKMAEMTSFENFYELAEARNAALVKNTLAAMEKNSTNVAVLVTGGFHSVGIEEELKKGGATFASFTPRMTKVENKSGVEALSVFAQEKTPLDELFEGQKLFLAQPGATKPILAQGAVQTAASALRTDALSFKALQAWFQRATGWPLLESRKLLNGTIQLIWRNTIGKQSVLVDSNNRIFLLNTTAFLAPLLTAIHVSVTPISLFSLETVGFFLTYKVILSLSTLLHELAHLSADRQLTWKNVHEQWLRTTDEFVSGWDISTAFVEITEKRPIPIRLVAIAGPLLTASLAVVGWSFLYIIPSLGLSFLSANIVLFILNVIYSDDWLAFFTGRLPSGVTGMALTSGTPSNGRYQMNFDVELTSGSEGQRSIREAKTNIFSGLPAPFNQAESEQRSRIRDFLEKAIAIATKRNIQRVTISRSLENNQLVFRILENKEEGLEIINGEEEDWNNFISRAEEIGGVFSKTLDSKTNLTTYAFSLPIERSIEERFHPKTPATANDIDNLLFEAFSRDDVADVLYILNHAPSRIDTKALFYLAEQSNPDLAEKATEILLERIKTYEVFSLGFIADFFGRSLQKKTTTSLQRTSAFVLMNIVQRKDLIPESVSMIDFPQLHRTTLSISSDKNFRISVKADMEGTVSIQVIEERNRFFRSIAWLGRKVGVKRTPETQNGVFTFSQAEIAQPVFLRYAGTLADDVLKAFISRWSQAAPLATLVQYKHISNQVSFAESPMGRAFLEASTGFAISQINADGTVNLEKRSDPSRPDGSGTSRSRFTGGLGTTSAVIFLTTLGTFLFNKIGMEGLYLTAIVALALSLLRYIVDLFDESGHGTAIKALGFKINWDESHFLRFNPILRYHPQEDRPKAMAFISVFPPIIWLVLATWSTQLLLYSPNVFFGFDSFWSAAGAIFGPWYMLVASYGQWASYYLTWNPNINDFSTETDFVELNDLQRFWIQVWSPENQHPVFSGTVRSQFFRVGRFWSNTRALFLALIALIPNNNTAQTIQNMVAVTAATPETELFELEEKALGLFKRYKETLKKSFSNKVAAAAHDNDTDRDILELWDKISDPQLKTRAKERQLDFVTIVKIVHAGIRDLGKSDDDFSRALWTFMKLIDFKGKGDLGSRYEDRPVKRWAQIENQAQAVRQQLPKIHGTARSQFLKWPSNNSVPQPGQPQQPTQTGDATASRSGLPRTIYVFPGGEGNGPRSGDQILSRVLVNLLARSFSESTPSSNPSIKGSDTTQPKLGETLFQNSKGKPSGETSVQNGPASLRSETENKTGNNTNPIPTGVNANATVTNTQQNQPSADQSSNLFPATPKPLAANSNPTQLDRRAFRPLTKLPYVFAAMGFTTLSLVGLTQIVIHGTYGFEISRASLTYLTYFGGVLFSLSLIGQRPWKDLLRRSDHSDSWLKKVLGPGYSDDLDVAADSQMESEGITPTVNPSRLETYVHRTLSAMGSVSQTNIVSGDAAQPQQTTAPLTFTKNPEQTRRESTRELLQVVVEAIQVLTRTTQQSPVAVLNAINAIQQQQTPTFETSVVLQMAKATRQRALLSAVYRSLFRNDPFAKAQISKLEYAAPLEFLEFRRAALILQAGLAQRLKGQRISSESIQTRQLRILQKMLESPTFLDKASVNILGNQGTVPVLSLDRTFPVGQPLRVEIDGPKSNATNTSFSTVVETAAEADLALVSAVEAAVEVLTQKKATSKQDILQMIIEGQLSGADMKLVLEFVSTSLKAVETKSKPNGTGTRLTALQINSKVQNAAQFLLSELQPKGESTQRSINSGARFPIPGKSRSFTTVARSVSRGLVNAAAALALATSLGAASAASTMDTSLQTGLTKAAVSGVVAATPAFEIQVTPTPTNEGPAVSAPELIVQKPEQKRTTLKNSNTDLERLAEDLITLVRATAATRSSSGEINLESVLPRADSLGLFDNNPALALQILTENQQAELEVLIFEEIKTLTEKETLTPFEVQLLFQALYLNNDLVQNLEFVIGNKNVGLPLKGVSDLDIVNRVLKQMPNPRQKLILFISEKDEAFFRSNYENLISQRRIELKTTSAISKQGEKLVLSFQQLASGLSAMTTTDRQNLVILLEDGIAWNTDQLEQLKALGSVGFAFTKDFVSGVTVGMDIQFLLKLAKQMGTHA